MENRKSGAHQHALWLSGYAALCLAGEDAYVKRKGKPLQASGERRYRASAKWPGESLRSGFTDLYSELEVKEIGAVKIFCIQ